METNPPKTFVIDCNECRAKVAATEAGRVERFGTGEGSLEPWGERVLIGNCPNCGSILVGRATQVDFEGYDAEVDRWTDVVRVFPKPSKVFSSYRIPRVVTDSLVEADRCLQANANIAACVMFGRALEALCNDVLDSAKRTDSSLTEVSGEATSRRSYMSLAEGLKKLRDQGVIDRQLFDWSQQLRAFRNVGA